MALYVFAGSRSSFPSCVILQRTRYASQLLQQLNRGISTKGMPFFSMFNNGNTPRTVVAGDGPVGFVRRHIDPNVVSYFSAYKSDRNFVDQSSKTVQNTHDVVRFDRSKDCVSFDMTNLAVCFPLPVDESTLDVRYEHSFKLIKNSNFKLVELHQNGPSYKSFFDQAHLFLNSLSEEEKLGFEEKMRDVTVVDIKLFAKISTVDSTDQKGQQIVLQPGDKYSVAHVANPFVVDDELLMHQRLETEKFAQYKSEILGLDLISPKSTLSWDNPAEPEAQKTTNNIRNLECLLTSAQIWLDTGKAPLFPYGGLVAKSDITDYGQKFAQKFIDENPIFEMHDKKAVLDKYLNYIFDGDKPSAHPPTTVFNWSRIVESLQKGDVIDRKLENLWGDYSETSIIGQINTFIDDYNTALKVTDGNRLDSFKRDQISRLQHLIRNFLSEHASTSSIQVRQLDADNTSHRLSLRPVSGVNLYAQALKAADAGIGEAGFFLGHDRSDFEAANPQISMRDASVGGVYGPISAESKALAVSAVADDRSWKYKALGLDDSEKDIMANFMQSLGVTTATKDEMFLAPVRSKGVLQKFLSLDQPGPVLMPFPAYPGHINACFEQGREILGVNVEAGYDAFIDYLEQHIKDLSVVLIPVIGNPISRLFTDEQVTRLRTLFDDNPQISVLIDAAYAGYQEGELSDIVDFKQKPKEGVIRAMYFSASKATDCASGPAYLRMHPDLGDELTTIWVKTETSESPFVRAALIAQMQHVSIADRREDWNFNRNFINDNLQFELSSVDQSDVFGKIRIIPADAPPFITLDMTDFCKEKGIAVKEITKELWKSGISILPIDGISNGVSSPLLRISVTGDACKDHETMREFIANLVHGLKNISASYVK